MASLLRFSDSRYVNLTGDYVGAPIKGPFGHCENPRSESLGCLRRILELSVLYFPFVGVLLKIGIKEHRKIKWLLDKMLFP